MSAIAFYLVLPFLYLISLLPFPVLYLLSDIFYVLLYYVVGYRKKVVLENLRKSFPNKTEKEIQRICKDFFHYLCDLFLETFLTLTISKKSMLKHCTFAPGTQEIFDRYAEKKQSVMIVMGHYGNWELAGNTFSLLCKQRLYVIYHPLSNKYFDKLIYDMRSRFGTGLIAMKNTFKVMLSQRKEVTATAFIADQTPSPENAYWTTFLNQDTPVFRGAEIIASKLNYPVIYASVRRIKRGYYQITGEVLCENPKDTKEGEISEMHTRRLEKDIIAQPEIWLWSHRRWKHKRPNA